MVNVRKIDDVEGMVDTCRKMGTMLLFLDDILVFANTLEEHNQRLDRVLQAVGDAGITLNPRKCLFAMDKVIYLGYEIDWQGIKPFQEFQESCGDKGFSPARHCFKIRIVSRYGVVLSEICQKLRVCSWTPS